MNGPLEWRDVREHRLAKFRQNVARFRLYRLRFLQVNTKYAFCSIFQNLPDSQAEIFEIWQHFANFTTFAIFSAEISRKLLLFQTDLLRKF